MLIHHLYFTCCWSYQNLLLLHYTMLILWSYVLHPLLWLQFKCRLKVRVALNVPTQTAEWAQFVFKWWVWELKACVWTRFEQLRLQRSTKGSNSHPWADVCFVKSSESCLGSPRMTSANTYCCLLFFTWFAVDAFSFWYVTWKACSFILEVNSHLNKL